MALSYNNEDGLVAVLDNGRPNGYRSSELPRRFETHKDHGWQVQGVTPPPWCGGYVDRAHCR